MNNNNSSIVVIMIIGSLAHLNEGCTFLARICLLTDPQPMPALCRAMCADNNDGIKDPTTSRLVTAWCVKSNEKQKILQ
jgi:hypothetical protein